MTSRIQSKLSYYLTQTSNPNFSNKVSTSSSLLMGKSMHKEVVGLNKEFLPSRLKNVRGKLRSNINNNCSSNRCSNSNSKSRWSSPRCLVSSRTTTALSVCLLRLVKWFTCNHLQDQMYNKYNNYLSTKYLTNKSSNFQVSTIFLKLCNNLSSRPSTCRLSKPFKLWMKESLRMGNTSRTKARFSWMDTRRTCISIIRFPWGSTMVA